ncbi:MAG: Rrf2 family transcriptional regulator, partial [Clostridia bacterium]|nr:Rrf2 family transcriptional regulator [Clostridia bacterium]
MMISTRGRYALRVLVDLTENGGDKSYIAMKEVAARQNISLKYLERILPTLVRAGFIEGAQGKGGGYRLRADPKNITVGQVMRLTEGDLAPVACLESGAPRCPRTDCCRTLPVWKGLRKVITEYLDGI